MAFGGGHIVDPPASQASLGGPFLPLSGGTLTGDLTITPSSNDIHTLQVNQTGGTVPVLTVDTLDSEVIVRGSQDFASVGAQLLISIAFNNATYWTPGTGWAVISTLATATAATGTLAATAANFTPTVGVTYQVRFKCGLSGGAFTVSLGGATSPTIQPAAIAAATFLTFYLTAVNTNPLTFTPIGTFTGTINSVSTGVTVKAVTVSRPSLVSDDSTGIVNAELRGFTQASKNFALGPGAMVNTLSTAASDTAIGETALAAATSAQSSTGIGANAAGLTSASDVTAIGAGALANALTGTGATAIGALALGAAQVGSLWTAIGFNAGAALNNGVINDSGTVLIGASAGSNITTGSANIVIGTGAPTLVSGTGNVLIGTGVDVPTAGTSNLLNIVGTLIGNTSTKEGYVNKFIRATSTTPDTASVTADEVVLVTTGASAFAENIPTPVGNAGKVFTVKKVDAGAGAVTITPATGTIDGGATFSLATQNKYVTIVSDGANYQVIANN